MLRRRPIAGADGVLGEHAAAGSFLWVILDRIGLSSSCPVYPGPAMVRLRRLMFVMPNQEAGISVTLPLVSSTSYVRKVPMRTNAPKRWVFAFGNRVYFTSTTKQGGLSSRRLLVSKFQDRNSLLNVRAEEAGNN